MTKIMKVELKPKYPGAKITPEDLNRIKSELEKKGYKVYEVAFDPYLKQVYVKYDEPSKAFPIAALVVVAVIAGIVALIGWEVVRYKEIDLEEEKVKAEKIPDFFNMLIEKGVPPEKAAEIVYDWSKEKSEAYPMMLMYVIGGALLTGILAYAFVKMVSK